MSTANKGEAADRTEAHKELQFITGNNEATANTPPASSLCVRDALRTTPSLRAHLLLTIKASVDVTAEVSFSELPAAPFTQRCKHRRPIRGQAEGFKFHAAV